MAEKTVADIVAVVRGVEPACQPVAVRFPHDPTAGDCILESLMALRPTYGASCTEVVLPLEVMERPRPQADKALFRLSERYLTMRSAQDDEAALGYVGLVRNAVQRALAEGNCEQETIARELGCGVRTLQRRLAREGATLRGIVDECRRERARALLEKKWTIAEVGFALGYSEPAAFQHAFRRWYGVSPRAWSQSLPQATG